MLKNVLNNLNCKICGSPNTLKDGLIKGVQRWECKACGSKFLDNGALPGMKTPFIQSSSALRMHYEGMSLNRIQKQLQRDFKDYPSRSSIIKWTNIYPYRVLEAVKDCHPDVGDTWIAIETMVKLCNKQLWIWDVLDRDTLFLLTTQVSPCNNASNLQVLIEKAVEKAGKTPKLIIADTSAVPLRLDSLAFHYDTAFGERCSFTIDDGATSEIEQLNRVFQERTYIIGGLKSIDRAIQFTNGWLVNYNYFNRLESLGRKTPAEMANIKYSQLRTEYSKRRHEKNLHNPLSI
jgi:transposase-like protein